jgi:hypothetical protein
MKIDCACPACSKPFSIDGQMAGEIAMCPCGDRFKIPGYAAPLEVMELEVLPEDDYRLSPSIQPRPLHPQLTAAAAPLNLPNRNVVPRSSPSSTSSPRRYCDNGLGVGILILIGGIAWFEIGFLVGTDILFPIFVVGYGVYRIVHAI